VWKREKKCLLWLILAPLFQKPRVGTRQQAAAHGIEVTLSRESIASTNQLQFDPVSLSPVDFSACAQPSGFVGFIQRTIHLQP
jgi:hypothetical protein